MQRRQPLGLWRRKTRNRKLALNEIVAAENHLTAINGHRYDILDRLERMVALGLINPYKGDRAAALLDQACTTIMDAIYE